jgi:hypothetical protein
MKPLVLTFVLVLIAAVSVSAGSALARPQAHVSTLRIVMHDPGCHSFLVGGKFLTKTSVSGPVKVANYDEATLIVKGTGTTKKIPVGKQLLLSHGSYTITMVGQAPDDNHLKLTVS